MSKFSAVDPKTFYLDDDLQSTSQWRLVNPAAPETAEGQTTAGAQNGCRGALWWWCKKKIIIKITGPGQRGAI